MLPASTTTNAVVYVPVWLSPPNVVVADDDDGGANAARKIVVIFALEFVVPHKVG